MNRFINLSKIAIITLTAFTFYCSAKANSYPKPVEAQKPIPIAIPNPKTTPNSKTNPDTTTSPSPVTSPNPKTTPNSKTNPDTTTPPSPSPAPIPDPKLTPVAAPVTPFSPKFLGTDSGEWWENIDTSSNIRAFRFDVENKTAKLYFRKGSDASFNYKLVNSEEKNTDTTYINFTLAEYSEYKLETVLRVKDPSTAKRELEIEMDELKPKAPRIKKITDKVFRFKIVKRKD